MKTHYLVFGTFLLLIAAENAFAASFDCRKAATAVEKMICADDELSKLDEALSKAYIRALEQTDIKKQIIESQRQWQRNFRDACQDSGCLKKVYEIRLKELALAAHGIVIMRPTHRGSSSPEGERKGARSQAIRSPDVHSRTTAKQFQQSTASQQSKSEHEPPSNEQLLRAAQSGTTEQFKTLLARGGDVNAKTDTRFTLLMYAAENEDPQMARVLIDRGANVNARDGMGTTALMTAAEGGNLEVVKRLIQKKADVNAVNDDGRHPPYGPRPGQEIPMSSSSLSTKGPTSMQRTSTAKQPS